MIGHCFAEVWLDDRTTHPAGGLARCMSGDGNGTGERCRALALLAAPSNSGRTLTVLAEATADNTAGEWFVGQVPIEALPDPDALRHTYGYDSLDEAIRVWSTVAHVETPIEVLRDAVVATTYAVPHPPHTSH